MNYLHKNLEFTTVEEGEKQLADAEKIRDSMGGALYHSILTDDVEEIKSKLQRLKISECFNKVQKVSLKRDDDGKITAVPDPNGNYTMGIDPL